MGTKRYKYIYIYMNMSKEISIALLIFEALMNFRENYKNI